MVVVVVAIVVMVVVVVMVVMVVMTFHLFKSCEDTFHARRPTENLFRIEPCKCPSPDQAPECL